MSLWTVCVCYNTVEERASQSLGAKRGLFRVVAAFCRPRRGLGSSAHHHKITTCPHNLQSITCCPTSPTTKRTPGQTARLSFFSPQTRPPSPRVWGDFNDEIEVFACSTLLRTVVIQRLAVSFPLPAGPGMASLRLLVDSDRKLTIVGGVTYAVRDLKRPAVPLF